MLRFIFFPACEEFSISSLNHNAVWVEPPLTCLFWGFSYPIIQEFGKWLGYYIGGYPLPGYHGIRGTQASDVKFVIRHLHCTIRSNHLRLKLVLPQGRSSLTCNSTSAFNTFHLRRGQSRSEPPEAESHKGFQVMVIQSVHYHTFDLAFHGVYR